MMSLTMPLFLLLPALADTPAPAEWPQWRGAERAGVWQGVELPARLETSALGERWRKPIGGGYAGIAVSRGRVVTMDSPRRGAERVLALEAGTGAEVWTREYAVDYGDMDYASGPRSTPTVDGDRVYTQGAAGHIHALDLATGKVLWTVDAARRYGGKLPEWGHAASPLVVGDLVLFQVGGQPTGTIAVFEKGSGEERWRALADRPGYSSPVLIDIGGKPQVAFWSAENVVGLAPETGEVLWQVPYASTYDVAIISPVFHDGLLLVSGFWEGSKAIDLRRPEAPRVVWEGQELSCLMSTPLYRDGHLYALDRAKGLLCIEWQSGKILWSDDHRVTPKERNPQASLVWAGDRAVMLNALGELILARLSPAGYEELGRVGIIGKTWAHPAFAGQDVFARSDEEVVCVRVGSGGDPE